MFNSEVACFGVPVRIWHQLIPVTIQRLTMRDLRMCALRTQQKALLITQVGSDYSRSLTGSLGACNIYPTFNHITS